MKTKIWIILCGILFTVVLITILYLFGYPPFITNAIKLKPVSLMTIEYLKVICTWPVAVFSSVVFLSVTFKTSLSEWFSHLKISYGGAIISSDLQNSKMSELKTEKIPEPTNANQASQPTPPMPVNNADPKKEAQQWRLAAYLWEYSYLNHFLVPNTKRILLWLDGINKISLEIANSVWAPLIPSLQEREAILRALMQHHLVLMTNDNREVEITPKGKEYVAMMLKPPLNA